MGGPTEVWEHLKVGDRIRCPDFVHAKATKIDLDPGGDRFRIDENNLNMDGPDRCQSWVTVPHAPPPKGDMTWRDLVRADPGRGTAIFEVVDVARRQPHCLINAKRLDREGETITFSEGTLNVERVR